MANRWRYALNAPWPVKACARQYVRGDPGGLLTYRITDGRTCLAQLATSVSAIHRDCYSCIVVSLMSLLRDVGLRFGFAALHRRIDSLSCAKRSPGGMPAKTKAAAVDTVR